MKRPIISLFALLFLFSCKKDKVESALVESQYLGVFRQYAPNPTGFPRVQTYENVFMKIEVPASDSYQKFIIVDGNIEIFKAKLKFKNDSDLEIKYESMGSLYEGIGKYDVKTEQISFSISNSEFYSMTFQGNKLLR